MSRTALALCATLVLVTPACKTALDGTDREALFLAARVRVPVEGPMPEKETFFEGSWTRASGDAGEFDYDLDTVNAGMSFEDAWGEQGRLAVGVGLSVLATSVDSDLARFDDDLSVGPYVGGEVSWRASDVVEPYARAEVSGYLLEFSSLLSLEVGARFHVADHVALFGGWHYGHYDLRDIDGVTNVDRVELDASGVVLGLSFEF